MKVSTNIYQRWLALFLCIVMFASMLPIGTAFADEPEVDTDEVSVAAVEEAAAVPEVQPVVEEPVVVPEVQPAVEEPVAVSEAQPVVEEPVVIPEVQPVVEEPVVVPEVQPAVEEPVVVPEVQPAVEEPAAQQETQMAAQPEVLPVRVIFNVQPAGAVVEVYTKDAFGVKQPAINAELDGSYLLLPGYYFYTVSADGYSAVGETALAVVTSVLPQEVNVVMSAVAVEEKLSGEVSETAETGEVKDLDITSSKVVMGKVTKSGNGLKVTWTPLTGAEKYRVWRKGPGDTSWKRLGDTTAASYTDTNVSNGKTYTYIVRGVRGSNLSAYSNSDAISGTYWNYATPKLKGTSILSDGIKVTWESVGSVTYRVYHKGPSDTNWIALGNTSATSYIDKQVVSGKTYRYTVRVTGYSSDYDHTGIARTFYGKASLTKVENSYNTTLKKGCVKLTWAPVDGMNYFRIERKLKGDVWADGTIKNLGTVPTQTGTITFLDNDVSSGVEYSYRIIGTSDSDGKNRIGTYDATGKNITFYDAPELDPDPVITANGVTINWTPVTGVIMYRVFRTQEVNGSGKPINWQKLADVKATTYTDKTAAAGLSDPYYYTVRCLSANGSTYISGYDPVGVSTPYTNTPIMLEAVPGKSGTTPIIFVRWKPVKGAKYYQVYRRTENGIWEKPSDGGIMGPISGTPQQIEYIDTDPSGYAGTKFWWTVRVVTDSTGNTFASAYDEVGVSATCYPWPKNVKAEPVDEGIMVTWDNVTGAPSYEIFRRKTSSDPDAKWTEIGTTTGTSFTDSAKNLTSGVEYEYYVAVLDAEGTLASAQSDISGTEHKATFFAAPALVSLTLNTNGLTLTWEKVASVTDFIIYRKTPNSTWAELKDKDGNTIPGTAFDYDFETQYYSYTDLTCTSGTTYTYTVACKESGKVISGYDKAGLTETYIGYNDVIAAGFSVTKLQNRTAGILVEWSPVDGVMAYNVYRREKDTEKEAYQLIGQSTTTSFLDTEVKNNNQAEYHYSVKCVSANGQEVSDFAKELSTNGVTRWITPVLKDITVQSALNPGEKGKITITWNPVGGVDGVSKYYNIWRKKNNDSFEKIATLVSGTTYVDEYGVANLIDGNKMSSGATYTYTVRVGHTDGRDLSDFDRNGLSTVFLHAPALVTPERNANGILVAWEASSGAEGYKIYRKLDGASSWSLVATVKGYTTLTWTDTNVLTGSNYTYTVRAYKGSALSGYDKDGVSITALDTPSITSIGNVKNGVKLSWGKVGNATSYEYRYKEDGGDWLGGWISVGNTTSTTVTGAHKSGVKYIFQVRAAKGGSKSAGSATKTIIFYDQPVLKTAKYSAGTAEYAKVKITWDKVNLAVKYRVYRKEGSGSFSKLADTTNTYYVDEKAQVNKLYTYTVRVIDKNGNAVSAYDKTGIQPDVGTIPFKLATPGAPTVSPSTGQMTIKWSRVGNYQKYRVYRKTQTGSWTKVGDVTSSSSTISYTDKTTSKGTYYEYRVACLSSNGQFLVSESSASSGLKLAR